MFAARCNTQGVPQFLARVLEQMERQEKKTVDEHYTEGKPTSTEAAKLPCSILIIR
jgi:hypothetical protein